MEYLYNVKTKSVMQSDGETETFCFKVSERTTVEEIQFIIDFLNDKDV